MLSLILYFILILCCLYSGSFLLLCTMLADYFLIFTNNFAPGILFFIVFQMGCRRLLRASLTSLAVPALLGTLLLFLLGVTSPVILLAGCYGICLLSNVLCAWNRGEKTYLFIFTLLLLCDLHVVIANMNILFPSPEGILGFYQQRIAPYALWVFYLPSQLMLSRILHRQNLRRMPVSPLPR